MRNFQKGFWYDVELACRVTGKGVVARSEQLVLAITKDRKSRGRTFEKHLQIQLNFVQLGY